MNDWESLKNINKYILVIVWTTERASNKTKESDGLKHNSKRTRDETSRAKPPSNLYKYKYYLLSTSYIYATVYFSILLIRSKHFNSVLNSLSAETRIYLIVFLLIFKFGFTFCLNIFPTQPFLSQKLLNYFNSTSYHNTYTTLLEFHQRIIVYLSFKIKKITILSINYHYWYIN